MIMQKTLVHSSAYNIISLIQQMDKSILVNLEFKKLFCINSKVGDSYQNASDHK